MTWHRMEILNQHVDLHGAEVICPWFYVLFFSNVRKRRTNLHMCISVFSCRIKLVGHQLCKHKKCAKQNKPALISTSVILQMSSSKKSCKEKENFCQDRHFCFCFSLVLRGDFPAQVHCFTLDTAPLLCAALFRTHSACPREATSP